MAADASSACTMHAGGFLPEGAGPGPSLDPVAPHVHVPRPVVRVPSRARGARRALHLEVDDQPERLADETGAAVHGLPGAVYWSRLTEGVGEEGPCDWLKDKFGLSWQVVPTRLTDLISDPDQGKAARAMQAMLSMSKLDIAALEKTAAGG
ncbi:hypothetical protein FE633_15870 [Streptomyces montanus]|uniref:PhnB-like domain-containing protein n=1 Tax=Streptomyces montanus TaxID=2580423 RepID=A0A5R9FMV6_9ACTN|nr:hypothetical protein FE633_15870 [Streptomyces montanus]